MPLDAASALSLTTPAAPTGPVGRGVLTESQRQFAGILGRMDQPRPLRPGERNLDANQAASIKTEEQARTAAQQFVAVSLVQPLLSQLRASNAASGVFAPSQGEKQFQAMYDAQIAERIVKASNFGIVDKLTEQLMKRIRGRGEQPADTSGAVDVAA